MTGQMLTWSVVANVRTAISRLVQGRALLAKLPNPRRPSLRKQTLCISPKQFSVLGEILADYLQMVGKDPNRALRIKTANELLKRWGKGEK
jgi:hypothetical protein